MFDLLQGQFHKREFILQEGPLGFEQRALVVQVERLGGMVMGFHGLFRKSDRWFVTADYTPAITVISKYKSASRAEPRLSTVVGRLEPLTGREAVRLSPAATLLAVTSTPVRRGRHAYRSAPICRQTDTAWQLKRGRGLASCDVFSLRSSLFNPAVPAQVRMGTCPLRVTTNHR